MTTMLPPDIARPSRPEPPGGADGGIAMSKPAVSGQCGPANCQV